MQFPIEISHGIFWSRVRIGVWFIGRFLYVLCVCVQAFVKMAKLEQERAEQQRRRDEEALKRRKEHLSRIKRMLEAAFDGDTDQIKKLLKEVCFRIIIFRG